MSSQRSEHKSATTLTDCFSNASSILRGKNPTQELSESILQEDRHTHAVEKRACFLHSKDSIEQPAEGFDTVIAGGAASEVNADAVGAGRGVCSKAPAPVFSAKDRVLPSDALETEFTACMHMDVRIIFQPSA